MSHLEAQHERLLDEDAELDEGLEEFDNKQEQPAIIYWVYKRSFFFFV